MVMMMINDEDDDKDMIKINGDADQLSTSYVELCNLLLGRKLSHQCENFFLNFKAIQNL